ncbi:MAG: glutamyl-tRNA synthetase [Parcubacteria group bacterium GW2011_GWC1_42_11]|uniref:Glutamate--tRNA ligase n=1 Tax=Candidatus Nomurabacteria bacterium GW2011_GWC2_42_20 TaxID=1618756 RepID=A0A0G0ZEC1_9BACT|nr:MAG: glutamyl-tRNA synthetase [Parcubacteria group bacterium GW2011_GWC1_42_11]KKS47029.1 MAG: glutamyl-tRNA synthetase [Candidatus Nomurabacteria bacterium GW2011_GWC2_42_20]KKS59234.1 MAG: glutamyl-tRNA synthetase [Candidatus Nomurabacteria bacterium GW2011_GWA2_42_41]KKT09169.1 MAG: glutamyl-tRNA synthetase [Candidatus Nomurabacteria bacterium GW2011_GWB1_43_20]TAN35498.1 MAG: glutamate--tRNA ligase [Patescibacteria group bacterium]HBH71276.1 glutamate--tRNA ligase [Candidatus Yonathbact
MTEVITRFAPSPTGVLHIGSVRTALYSWLYARQNNGKFILRIEDTDKERSKKEFEDNILDGLNWLGLNHDEFYRQSDRSPIYKKHLIDLIAKGAVYLSKEEPKEPGERAEVLRFKNPNRVVTFHDEARGDISFDTTELGDFVIAKDFESPLYHFAVVVDDFEMGVTHIIRGDDAISNTPRQILIQEALGAPRPIYAHLPMILAPDKSKLSKRHGALAVTEYREEGYLPEAIINFVALMGWNPGNDQEIVSIAEMIKLFSLPKIQKSGAVFNIDKLKWLNKFYIKTLTQEKLANEILLRLTETLKEYAKNNPMIFSKMIPIIVEHISFFEEVSTLAESGEYDYFFVDPMYEREGALWKDEKDPIIASQKLKKVLFLLNDIDDAFFTPETIKTAVWNYATEVGRGSVLWPMRFALSGREKSPDPFTLASILGKEATIRRIEYAMKLLLS